MQYVAIQRTLLTNCQYYSQMFRYSNELSECSQIYNTNSHVTTKRCQPIYEFLGLLYVLRGGVCYDGGGQRRGLFFAVVLQER